MEAVGEKIKAPDHFVAVGIEGKRFLKSGDGIMAEEECLIPGAVYDGFERARLGFPEAPGAVVAVFLFPVYQQDPFIFSEAAAGELHGEAEAGTAHTGDDIVV